MKRAISRLLCLFAAFALVVSIAYAGGVGNTSGDRIAYQTKSDGGLNVTAIASKEGYWLGCSYRLNGRIYDVYPKRLSKGTNEYIDISCPVSGNPSPEFRLSMWDGINYEHKDCPYRKDNGFDCCFCGRTRLLDTDWRRD